VGWRKGGRKEGKEGEREVGGGTKGKGRGRGGWRDEG